MVGGERGGVIWVGHGQGSRWIDYVEAFEATGSDMVSELEMDLMASPDGRRLTFDKRRHDVGEFTESQLKARV